MHDEDFISKILKDNEILASENSMYHEKCSKLLNDNLKLRNLEEENKKLNDRLNIILSSKSWKIMQPLRNIINVFKTKRQDIPNDAELCHKDVSTSNNDRMEADILLEKLLKYDVISFDIFDTLILRNISKPTLIFKLVGYRVGIDNFETYRVSAEKEARNVTTKKNREINIFDIYEVLGKYISIDVDEAIKTELEVEKDFCMANPYFQYIFKKLKENGKKIIIISDMYWPNSYIKDILKKCGYNGYEKIFVSCDYEVAKGSGELQKIASENFDNKLKYIHIGDNYLSDIKGSQLIGWDTYHYKKASDISSYNFFNNSLSSAINESIVSNYFYNGFYKKDIYFEYGFKYIGMLVCGYCQWLEDFARKNHIDKILFLARDMEIVYKIYKKYYNSVPSEYVVVSRTAALELNFDDLTEEFIEFYFKPRINSDESLENMLIDSDLSILVDKLNTYKLNPSDRLTDENKYIFKKMIYDNKNVISEYFKSSKTAAKKYLSELIGDSKSISVADLGWSGQIFMQLKYFITHCISNDIKIYGNYMGNSNNSKVNGYIESGYMYSYLFSYAHNKNLLLDTAKFDGNTKAMILEAIFSSKEKTLLKYEFKRNNYNFVYGMSTTDEMVISKLHNGIFEYASIYNVLTKKYKEMIKIAPTDAYCPFEKISSDFLYNYEVFKNIKEYKDSLPRFVGTRNITTIGEIMKDRKLM